MTLESKIREAFPRITTDQEESLERLGVFTVHDLLYHFPARYSDIAHIKNIADLAPGETAAIYGIVRNLKLKKGFRSKVAMATATIEDASGTIQATWFHQPYIAKMITEDNSFKFQGKVTAGKKGIYLANPEYESVAEGALMRNTALFGEGTEETAAPYPVYPESRGITSKWIYHAIQKIFGSGIIQTLVDPIPKEILEKYSLPALGSALIWIHTPRKETDALSARKRFAFEEVFLIQLEKQKDRQEAGKNPAWNITKDPEDLEKFTVHFPFEKTEAQEKAIADILQDMKSGRPMSRLLEGDVGSGKTAVAATTAYAVVSSRPNGQHFGALQVAYMCPTEILANQHFESFIKYFSHVGINVGLITSSGCKKFPSKINREGWTDVSRAQLLKWIANGEIPILIGTHSLIQKTVKFKHLAYVIIDEQHRFGTTQRKLLARKSDPKDKQLPHLLSMTATPIPRTLALTVYGDLDLTLLDQMPHGRKPIITDIIPPTKREETYEKVRAELASGRQAYVICPRIDEPDPTKEQAVNAKSVKEEAKRLKLKVFPEYEIDILHSKMTPTQKEETMRRFENKEIDILVATSLVEVGVNVPNATVILIEGAERFGLSQLHQLRGRVIRSNHQAYCFVFSDTSSQKSIDRLKALKTAKNGFELAEFDLIQRGAGELYGRKQWGISDVAMEAIKNLKMVEAARTEAQQIIATDPELETYPLLKKIIRGADERIHFE